MILTIALLLPAFSVTAFAAEDSRPEATAENAFASAQVTFADDSLLGEVEQIRLAFPDMADRILEWDFPYTDAFFSLPSEEFSMTMAQASMGLTVSAFRSDELSYQYETYLRGAGFTDIYSFGYGRAPSADSLSFVIGMKKIDGFTVIAAAACGQGYGNEWSSNFMVGEGERHEGFYAAARLFEDHLARFIEERGIKGEKKLWISGFSRTSAVGNILAADMIESGEFATLYAYLFGVPRTTQNPVRYPGIYNICGQYDPVPEVPLQSWGYERFGTDLYTPAQESDAEYTAFAHAAKAVGNKLEGKGFRNNPELNYQLRLIAESFGEFFPDTASYCKQMQGLLADAIINHSGDHVLELLVEAFSGLEPEKTQDRAKIDTFMDYVGYVLGQHLRAEQRQIEAGSWDPDESLIANIALEHLPVTYIRWLFSGEEPQKILASCNVSRRISVIGPVEITVLRDVRAISHIDQNGRVSYPLEDGRDVTNRDPGVFLMRNENVSIVTLPNDAEYTLRVETSRLSTVTFYDLLISPEKLDTEAGKMNLAEMLEGSYEFCITPGEEMPPSPEVIEGNYILLGSSDYEYSPTAVMNDELQATKHYFMSLRRVYRLALNLVISLVVILLACLILNLVHRHKVKKGHPPYSKWFVIVPHLIIIAGMLSLTAMVTYHLFAIDKVRIISGSLTVFVIFLLALRGTLRYKRLSSIVITAILFILFAMTLLFLDRTEIHEFSWLGIGLFTFAIVIGSAAAIYTFREPRAAKAAPASAEPVETAKQS